MENQENNNLSELDQLKAQYETLKQQFDQQEIVNDRLMKSSIKRNVDFFMRYRWKQIILYPLAAIIGLILIKYRLNNNLSIRLFWVLYCSACLTFELWITRKFQSKTLENNNLLTLSNHARSFKKLFSVFTVLNYSTALILICGILLSLVGELFNGESMMLTFLAVVVGMIIIGISEIRYKARACDEIVQKIEASENPTDKKSCFDRRQRWFCIAMIVVFLVFDVWAYTIVGTYLKLPPMWRTVEYVRADNDFSTEGKLAIWEVFADTVVPEKDVPELRQALSVLGDSYVLMEDPSDEVRIYVLKKNSQEGPAISSAILGGKPMVKKIVVTKPSKYPSNGSIPMIVVLTPEARQLWSEFTKQPTGKRGVVTMDGVVVQECLENGCFPIMKEWTSKEELDAFCEQLIRQ